MKKKYVIATTSSQNYNPLFYTETVGFSNDVPKIAMSMKKAIVICKSSPLSTWIIEYEFPKLKNIIESTPYEFEDFIENCKSCGLEVIETRPSIYTPSEVESAIPKEVSPCGYAIKHQFGSFICILNGVEGGVFSMSNLSKSAIIFRTKKEAEFQAKVLELKTNEKFSIEKVYLNTFFKH